MKLIDMTGRVFGRLTVLGRDKQSSRTRWFCRCSCGGTTSVLSDCLGRRVNSCGCLRREATTRNNTTHGLSGRPEYVVWHSMRRRCLDPSHRRYLDYGGRGITVCDRWREFPAFLADVGPRPGPSYTIDRIDNNGAYEPGNCRWATKESQVRNKRSNTWLEFRGRRMIAADWARELGLSRSVLARRLSEWTLERALTTPAR